MGALTQQLRGGLGDPPTWLREALGAVAQSSSGVTVTAKSAMTFAAVFGAVGGISTDVAKLPTEMYKHLQPVGKERAPDHPLDPILRDVAYEDASTGTVISAFHAKQFIQGSALLWGNGYAHVGFNGRGEVIDMLPLPPSRVYPYREWGTNRLLYRVTTTAGVVSVPAAEIFHLKNVAGGSDFDSGVSPVQFQRETMGLGIAQAEYLARFYGNDASPGGILTHPGRLRPEAKKKMKQGWEEAHAPMSKKHRIAILEEGVTWTSIGMPLQDAQFLENRKFQIEEVCRIYRYPPHKLFYMDKGDKSSVEQDNIVYVTDCLGGWLENWRSTIAAHLLMPAERKVYFAVFNTNPLLRGDFAARMNGYAVMLDRGVYSPDDVRDREDDNPIADGKGKGYYHQLNMVDVTKPPPPAPVPAPKAVGDQPQNPAEAQPAGPAGKGKLSLRSIAARQRYVGAHLGLFEIAAERVVGKEALSAQGWADTAKDRAEFLAMAAEFYQRFDAEVYHDMAPVMNVLAEAIRAEAADEVGLDGAMTPDAEAQVRLQAQGLAHSYVERALAALQQLVEDTVNVPLADEVRRWLTERQATLPVKIASNETVRLANAIAIQAFAEAGVPQYRWVKGKDCAWCDQLDGRSADVGAFFLEAGDKLAVEGQADYVAGVGVRAGPLHGGCSCTVAPVVPGAERSKPDPLIEMARAIREMVRRPRRVRRETDFKRNGNAIVGKVEVETEEPDAGQ